MNHLLLNYIAFGYCAGASFALFLDGSVIGGTIELFLALIQIPFMIILYDYLKGM